MVTDTGTNTHSPPPLPQTMTERPPHEDPPHISFVVTGFGPFRGVQDNPTSALARDLPSYLASARPDLAARTSTLIIETSADDVLSSLAEIFDGLEARATGAVVLLHLGVDYRGKCFKVERCAYNDATFRVPDERGYQPVAEVCVDSHGHGHRFSTSLPVDALVRRMRSDPIKGAGGDTAGGFTVNLVQPSSDPGPLRVQLHLRAEPEPRGDFQRNDERRGRHHAEDGTDGPFSLFTRSANHRCADGASNAFRRGADGGDRGAARQGPSEKEMTDACEEQIPMQN